MFSVDDKPETIHLYVVREEEERPHTAFPLFCSLLCLLGIAVLIFYSAQHPYYEHKRLTVPATFLPLKMFKAEVPILSTGMKTFPATYASGALTLTNGSILSETLPAGVIFSASNGIEVQTTESVFIPAGSASGYGVARVVARAVQVGKLGNIRTLAVNAVYGTALYARNLSPFTGGQGAYSVSFVTSNDRRVATSKVRFLLISKRRQTPAFLVSPCHETLFAADSKMVATYKVPSYMHVLTAHLSGKSFFVDAFFVARPRPVWIR